MTRALTQSDVACVCMQGPNYILVRGGWGPNNLTSSAELSSGLPATAGSHTVTISTVAWSARVRYVELSEIGVDRGACDCQHAVITEMGVNVFANTAASQCEAQLDSSLVNETALEPLRLCA